MAADNQACRSIPPAADQLDRELGGVRAGPHVHPAGVRGQVVHAVGRDLAELLIGEVVIIDLAGLAGALPLPAAGGVAADQLLLFRVNRDHRIAGRLECRDLLIDVAELLPITVRMLAPFDRLGVPVQA